MVHASGGNTGKVVLLASVEAEGASSASGIGSESSCQWCDLPTSGSCSTGPERTMPGRSIPGPDHTGPVPLLVQGGKGDCHGCGRPHGSHGCGRHRGMLHTWGTAPPSRHRGMLLDEQGGTSLHRIHPRLPDWRVPAHALLALASGREEAQPLQAGREAGERRAALEGSLSMRGR